MPERADLKTLKTLKAELLQDADTRAAYEAQVEEYAIARELIATRARAGLTISMTTCGRYNSD